MINALTFDDALLKFIPFFSLTEQGLHFCIYKPHMYLCSQDIFYY